MQRTDAVRYSVRRRKECQGELCKAVMKSRRLPHRNLSALLLMVIYLVITMSPLAPVALKNSYLAHATNGECVGDCNICGCSLDQRVNHTCCCEQKLKRKAKQEAEFSGCCKENREGEGPVLRCSCPCGSEKVLTLLNLPNSEVLPFVFITGSSCGLVTTEHHEHSRRMLTRFGEPPDPPPRLS